MSHAFHGRLVGTQVTPHKFEPKNATAEGAGSPVGVTVLSGCQCLIRQLCPVLAATCLAHHPTDTEIFLNTIIPLIKKI